MGFVCVSTYIEVQIQNLEVVFHRLLLFGIWESSCGGKRKQNPGSFPLHEHCRCGNTYQHFLDFFSLLGNHSLPQGLLATKPIFVVVPEGGL